MDYNGYQWTLSDKKEGGGVIYEDALNGAVMAYLIENQGYKDGNGMYWKALETKKASSRINPKLA